jgi:hypothetical protein
MLRKPLSIKDPGIKYIINRLNNYFKQVNRLLTRYSENIWSTF